MSMIAELGTCPVCDAAFVRDRRDKFKYRKVTRTAADPPAGAYYPELTFDLCAVWCPRCGWVKSLQSSDLRMAWTNQEFDDRQISNGS